MKIYIWHKKIKKILKNKNLIIIIIGSKNIIVLIVIRRNVIINELMLIKWLKL